MLNQEKVTHDDNFVFLLYGIFASQLGHSCYSCELNRIYVKTYRAIYLYILVQKKLLTLFTE